MVATFNAAWMKFAGLFSPDCKSACIGRRDLFPRAGHLTLPRRAWLWARRLMQRKLDPQDLHVLDYRLPSLNPLARRRRAETSSQEARNRQRFRRDAVRLKVRRQLWLLPLVLRC